eukprot:6028864-Karenia_brevis.AAC.1
MMWRTLGLRRKPRDVMALRRALLIPRGGVMAFKSQHGIRGLANCDGCQGLMRPCSEVEQARTKAAMGLRG